MKRRTLMVIALIVFVAWNFVTYVLIASRQPSKDMEERRGELAQQFAELQQRLKAQSVEHEVIRNQLQQARNDLEDIVANKYDPNESPVEPLKTVRPLPPLRAVLPRVDIPPIAVLVMACNRVTVSRSIDQLLKYRPSAEKFPIIVSQDCGHTQTANVIRSYGQQVTHLQQPDLSDFDLPKKDQKFKGYYMIARHYRWALNEVFKRMDYSVVIIVEDDLDISPDFFEYFQATYPVLHSDSTLWCVSAWNDNGKKELVSDEAELLYRTDFFPGLGWMLEKSLWAELEPSWPLTFWDDWMRHPDQRRDRACIRPEISRTSTFGKIGVSRGQYFDKHLKFIQHNVVPVHFTKKDLSYLLKANYDEQFIIDVYSTRLLTHAELVSGRIEENVVRIQYDDLASFKALSKLVGIMDDFKSGVPRTAYRGVVSIMFAGRRVFLAPPPDWKAYDTTWK